MRINQFKDGCDPGGEAAAADSDDNRIKRLALLNHFKGENAVSRNSERAFEGVKQITSLLFGEGLRTFERFCAGVRKNSFAAILPDAGDAEGGSRLYHDDLGARLYSLRRKSCSDRMIAGAESRDAA